MTFINADLRPTINLNSQEKMTIDVIMPTYNQGEFIAESIRSVLTQTYAPQKFIIVNDGSTDDTVTVINSFTDPRIVLISTENHGVSHARNIGIRKANADYVAFIDSDDLWAPKKLELQAKALITTQRQKRYLAVSPSSTQKAIKVSMVIITERYSIVTH